MCVGQSLNCVRLFATPRTLAHQAPLSMGFSRQEYWSGLPFPSPEDLPDPGIKPRSPVCRQILHHLSYREDLREKIVISTKDNWSNQVSTFKKKRILGTDHTSFTKINSKWITNLNVKGKTVKSLEDNIVENLGDLGFGNDFLDTTPKAQSMKKRIHACV